MKFSLNSFLNGKEIPPQKKRVLAIGAVAFVVLIFASFLLSLVEDDDAAASNAANNAALGQPQQLDPNATGQSGQLQLPSNQRYDFAGGNQQSAQQGNGLENLLNDNALQPPANVGVENDPFANMNGSRSEVNQSVQQGSQQGFGPAPIPGPNDQAMPQPAPAAPATLFCDSFTLAQQAESQKAMLAFQGISATVVQNQDGGYSLRIGPMSSPDEARQLFYSLSEKGLVQKCALVD